MFDTWIRKWKRWRSSREFAEITAKSSRLSADEEKKRGSEVAKELEAQSAEAARLENVINAETSSARKAMDAWAKLRRFHVSPELEEHIEGLIKLKISQELKLRFGDRK